MIWACLGHYKLPLFHIFDYSHFDAATFAISLFICRFALLHWFLHNIPKPLIALRVARIWLLRELEYFQVSLSRHSPHTGHMIIFGHFLHIHEDKLHCFRHTKAAELHYFSFYYYWYWLLVEEHSLWRLFTPPISSQPLPSFHFEPPMPLTPCCTSPEVRWFSFLFHFADYRYVHFSTMRLVTEIFYRYWYSSLHTPSIRFYFWLFSFIFI